MGTWRGFTIFAAVVAMLAAVVTVTAMWLAEPSGPGAMVLTGWQWLLIPFGAAIVTFLLVMLTGSR